MSPRRPRAARARRPLVVPPEPEPRRPPTWNPPGQPTPAEVVDAMIARWRREGTRRAR